MTRTKQTGRKRKAVDAYESEGISDDGAAPKSKKTKTASGASKSTEEPAWPLDKNKRATISEWKENTYVNIREFFEKDGKQLPGKKGIMLNLQAYSALVKAMPEINKKLKERGHEIDIGDGDEEDEEEEEEEEVVQKKVVKAKKEKKVDLSDDKGQSVVKAVLKGEKRKKMNIEATSDEEEAEIADEDEDDD